MGLQGDHSVHIIKLQVMLSGALSGTAVGKTVCPTGMGGIDKKP